MNESANGRIEVRARQPNRILVMEEDPLLLHLNVEVLIQHGYEVKDAEDGATAWKELQALNYRLLITDYKLLKETGIGLSKKLHVSAIEGSNRRKAHEPSIVQSFRSAP